MEKGYFLLKLKDTKLKDLAAVFPMIAGLTLTPFYRKKYKDLWLVGEADNEARDNGYHFFKYMRLHHKEQPCAYFISPKAKDAEKVKPLGPIVAQGSVKHWIMYFTCSKIISSQKGGKPNAALCAFIELKGWFRPHFVFLQHGITINKVDWALAEKCRFDCFITAAQSEYDYVKSTYGYPNGIVQFTGFSRFDNLHGFETIPNRILIMPTWRKWLSNPSSKDVIGETDFTHSRFAENWLKLLNSPALRKLAEQYSLEILFYPHRQLQKRLSEFVIENPCVKIIHWEDLDIQEALKSAALMITDWSSVFFDMFYMKKPVIFYQFDEADFRRYHYQEGWFDYHNNPFAKSYQTVDEVIAALEEAVKSQFRMSASSEAEHKKEFVYFDEKNSERIYYLLSKDFVQMN